MLPTPTASACPTSMAAATQSEWQNGSSLQLSPRRRRTAIGQGGASAPSEGPRINPNGRGTSTTRWQGKWTTWPARSPPTRRLGPGPDAHTPTTATAPDSARRGANGANRSQPALPPARALSVPSGHRDDRHRRFTNRTRQVRPPAPPPSRAGAEHGRCAGLLGSPGLDRGPLPGHGVRGGLSPCHPPVRPGQGKRPHGRSLVRIRGGLGAAVVAVAAVHRSPSAVGGGACGVHGRRRARARDLRLPCT